MKKLPLILALTLASTVTWAADCTMIGIGAPTEREDNTPLPGTEIKGYNVYLDQNNNDIFGEPIFVPYAGTVTYYCVKRVDVAFPVQVKTVDTADRVSSDFAGTTIPALVPPVVEIAPPKKPTIVCSGGETCKP